MKKTIIHLILLVSILLYSSACKTIKPVRPMERYEHLNEDFRISEITLPVSINFGEMEREINEELGGTLYEDDTDDYAIRAEKTADITLSLSGQELKYYVPLRIWVKKDLGLTEVEAEGDVAMDFKTSFEINSNWDIETETTLLDHEWVTKPRLKMGIIDIPIEKMMSIILKRSQATITKQIDDQIQSRLDLRLFVEEAWRTLKDPIAISKDPTIWLQVAPKSISMSPLVTVDKIVRSSIYISTNAELSAGKKPVSQIEGGITSFSELPTLEFAEPKRKGFELNMIADVPYDEATLIAKKYAVGETFEQGKYQVKIEDIDIYGSGNKLVVETDLSGDYKGKIYLEGIPHFNKDKNQIEMKEVEYELKTKNFLLKTMSWLFHKNFEKRIKEKMVFPLDKQFAEIKKKTAAQLKDFKVNNSMRIQGALDDLKIERTYLTPNSIRVQVSSSGKLNVLIDGLEN